jgi:hypothetical protein
MRVYCTAAWLLPFVLPIPSKPICVHSSIHRKGTLLLALGQSRSTINGHAVTACKMNDKENNN